MEIVKGKQKGKGFGCWKLIWERSGNWKWKNGVEFGWFYKKRNCKWEKQRKVFWFLNKEERVR